MKKVEAYVRHEAFEPIRIELLELGFPSLTISEVKGSGRQKGITERYRGASLTNYLRPKIKLECVVADRDVQTIVDSILKHARTGAVGDGKVFVLPVDESYRVRTGESGEEVLQAHPDAAATSPSLRRVPAAWSSACAPCTWRWSTPSSAATASPGWRRWRPARPAPRWPSSSRASARRWSPVVRRSPARRPRRRSSRTCAGPSWRTSAAVPTSSRARSCGGPGAWAATSRAGPSCS